MAVTAPSLIQLRRRVRSRLGVPASDQMFTDDQIDDAINLANETIAAEHNWPWDEITADVTVNNGMMTMPSDWRTTRSVFYIANGASIELRNVSETDLLRASTGSKAGSIPQIWAETGGRIYLRPNAPGLLPGVVLDYYRQPRVLIADVDGPYVPGHYSGAIIAKACEYLSQREDNASAAERYAADYLQWLGRMRRALRRSTGPISPRVREGGWI